MIRSMHAAYPCRLAGREGPVGKVQKQKTNL